MQTYNKSNGQENPARYRILFFNKITVYRFNDNPFFENICSFIFCISLPISCSENLA